MTVTQIPMTITEMCVTVKMHKKKLTPSHDEGVSEGVGFPKSRIRVSAGNSAPVRPSALARPVVTQGVSEGMGFPKSRIQVSFLGISCIPFM